MHPQPSGPGLEIDPEILALIFIASQLGVFPHHIKDGEIHINPVTFSGIKDYYLKWKRDKSVDDGTLASLIHQALKMATVHKLVFVSHGKQVWDPAVLNCKAGTDLGNLIKSRACVGDGSDGTSSAKVDVVNKSNQPGSSRQRQPADKNTGPRNANEEPLTKSQYQKQPVARKLFATTQTYTIPSDSSSSVDTDINTSPLAILPKPVVKPATAVSAKQLNLSPNNPFAAIVHNKSQTQAQAQSKIGKEGNSLKDFSDEQLMDKHADYLKRFESDGLAQHQITAMDKIGDELRRRMKKREREMAVGEKKKAVEKERLIDV